MKQSYFKYHKSLYNVAVKLQLEEKVLEELEALTELFKDQKFKTTIKKVLILQSSEAEKVLEDLFKDKLSNLTINLLKILVNDRTLIFLPKIYEAYKRHHNEQKGIDEIIIYSARNLNSQEQAKIKEKLQQTRKAKITVNFKQKQDLIGGIQIYEKGYIQDFSIRNRLEMLKKHLLVHNY